MRINVAKVRKTFGASETFEFKEAAQVLDSDDAAVKFIQPLDVTVKAANVGHGILLQGKVHTEVELDCSRCLGNFSLTVDTGFEEEVCHSSDVAAYLADHPEAVEEENYTVFSSDVLDITPLVVEHVLLALPMKPLCREECKGLCSRCGRNLNVAACSCEQEAVDPRLAGLASFFNKEK